MSTNFLGETFLNACCFATVFSDEVQPETIGILEEPGLETREEAAGREARFAALVERQSRFAFQVAYSILRNVHDAEDAVQEAFLKLYRGNAWESVDDERAFLARVAWRVAVSRIGKRVRQAPGRAADPDPDQLLIAADRAGAIHRLIDALPEDLRQPLALASVEELNSRQIAVVMGIAEGTVRTRLMRARQILRKKLVALMGSRYAG